MINSAPKIISWTGSLSVSTARARVKDLLDAFERSKIVFISVTGLRDIDLSCIQIVYSAAREAAKRGIQFELTGAVAPELSEGLVKCGLLKGPVGEGKRLLAELFPGIAEGART